MYYVAAGLFPTSDNRKEFKIVRPNGNHPCYITKNSNGLRLTSFHASLYAINEKKNGYLLTRVRHDVATSPPQHFIPKKSALWSYLRDSITQAEIHNQFYL